MTMTPDPLHDDAAPRGPSAVRSSVLRLLAAAAVVVLVAELAARVVGGQLAEPLAWYDATTQLKDGQVDELAGTGLDDMVIGTSMTLRGFDTQTYVDATGRTAYNAALPGAVPSVNERWLLDEILPRVRTGRVILGIQTIDFSAELHDENLARWEAARSTRTGFLGSLERWGSSVSGLIRHRQELRDPVAWMNLVRDRPGPIEDTAGTLTDLGFRDVYVDDFTDFARDRTAHELATINLEAASEAITRMASALEAEGIELVLVEMPVPQAYIDLHLEGQTSYDEIRAHYRGLADNLGIELIDLATDWDADERFTDYTHLDVVGAQRVAELVAGQLN
ncbi:MAG: hypothetical protein GY745_15265 [Actinomycetia bacterium]|nr:hypothetical protein [Actinomycetes bacterium]